MLIRSSTVPDGKRVTKSEWKRLRNVCMECGFYHFDVQSTMTRIFTQFHVIWNRNPKIPNYNVHGQADRVQYEGKLDQGPHWPNLSSFCCMSVFEATFVLLFCEWVSVIVSDIWNFDVLYIALCISMSPLLGNFFKISGIWKSTCQAVIFPVRTGRLCHVFSLSAMPKFYLFTLAVKKKINIFSNPCLTLPPVFSFSFHRATHHPETALLLTSRLRSASMHLPHPVTSVYRRDSQV